MMCRILLLGSLAMTTLASAAAGQSPEKQPAKVLRHVVMYKFKDSASKSDID